MDVNLVSFRLYNSPSGVVHACEGLCWLVKSPVSLFDFLL